jgi:hypothetical protein
MSPLPAGPGSGLSEPLTIRSVDAMLVTAPIRRPLGTSAMRITEAPHVLVDLQTEEGITDRAYLFCYLESPGRRPGGARGGPAGRGPDGRLQPGTEPRYRPGTVPRLDDEGMYWIEEPVRHDDYAASAEFAALLRTPKSALTFSPPRRRPTGSNTWTGPAPSSSSHRRWPAAACSRQTGLAPARCGTPTQCHISGGQTSLSMASLVRGPRLRIPLAAPGEKLL